MKKLTTAIVETQRRYLRRKNKVNTKIKSVSDLPRVIVNKSNKYNYVQLIDVNWNVVATSNDIKITEWTKTQRANIVWAELAKKALAKGVDTVVFDRNGYIYHGRIKAIADWARSGGLKF